MMDQAAHHIDLFFENPLDPLEVKQARQSEMNMVEDWVRSAYKRDASVAAAGGSRDGGLVAGGVGGGGNKAGSSLLV